MGVLHYPYMNATYWTKIKRQEYRKGYNGNLRHQLEVYKISKQNMIKREQLKDDVTF